MIATGITSALLLGVGIGAIGRMASPSRRRVATIVIVVIAALVGTAFVRMTGTVGTVEPQ